MAGSLKASDDYADPMPQRAVKQRLVARTELAGQRGTMLIFRS